MPSVLFVCTANLDRSPLACARLQQMVGHCVYEQAWRIESAGTWARQDQPVPSEVRAAGRELGLDLTTYRSRCVTGDLLLSFNIVLTMEQGHKEALQVEFPGLYRHIYLLCEMAGVQASICNPVHRTLADCRRMAKEIDEWLCMGYDRIVHLAR